MIGVDFYFKIYLHYMPQFRIVWTRYLKINLSIKWTFLLLSRLSKYFYQLCGLAHDLHVYILMLGYLKDKKTGLYLLILCLYSDSKVSLSQHSLGCTHIWPVLKACKFIFFFVKAFYTCVVIALNRFWTKSAINDVKTCHWIFQSICSHLIVKTMEII